MTESGAPAGWYPDPAGSGGQRYFDGVTWTGHFVPPPPPMPGYGYPVGQPPWKGAQYGRPPEGSGSLANPGRRLGARLLDALVLLPVLIIFAGVTIALIAPHIGPVFPKVNDNPNAPVPVPGFVWIYVAVFGCAIATGVVMVFYEAIATARYGRTLGKAWLHIRPVRTDGSPLGWGRSFGRVSLYFLSGFLSWLGLLDPLWCLWDGNQQCLHDKAVDTLVINDEVAGGPQGAPTESSVTDAAPVPGNWSTTQATPWTPQGGANPYAYAYWASVPAQTRKSGLAVASLVCSIVGLFLFALPAIVGVILGFVARSQIRQSGGSQTGSGLAVAGITVGIGVVALYALVIVGPLVTNH